MKTKLDTFALIQHWDWHIWAIGTLVILLVSALEGCYRGHRHYSDAAAKSAEDGHAKLKSELDKQQLANKQLSEEADKWKTEACTMGTQIARLQAKLHGDPFSRL